MSVVFTPSKLGDEGTTLILGKRMPKSSLAIRFTGSIDYLQAKFGELYTENATYNKLSLDTMFNFGSGSTKDVKIRSEIFTNIITDLYHINSIMWSPKSVKFSIEYLDELLNRLPFRVPESFQLPIYTNKLIAMINTVRTEVRQSELHLATFLDSDEITECSTMQVNLLKQALRYLNRLSSVMYAMINHYNRDEAIYATQKIIIVPA